MRRITWRGTMPQEESTLKDIAAYVAPFAVFIALSSIESKGLLGTRYEAVYVLKILVVSALLWNFRRRYPFFSRAGLGLACIAGFFGFVLWIALARLQMMIPGLQPLVESLLGTRAGYDPYASTDSPTVAVAFVAVRLFGLALVVP